MLSMEYQQHDRHDEQHAAPDGLLEQNEANAQRATKQGRVLHLSLSRTCSKACTWKLSRELQCSHLFGKNVEGVSLPPLFNRPWDRNKRFPRISVYHLLLKANRLELLSQKTFHFVHCVLLHSRKHMGIRVYRHANLAMSWKLLDHFCSYSHT